jgi:beta-glucosidase
VRRLVVSRVPRIAFVLALATMLGAGYLTVAAIARPDNRRPWMDTALSPDRRADLLIAQMTLDDKIALLHGASRSVYAGYVPANTRLGIPALYLEDGPAGVADGMTGVTQLPAPVASAASWDPALMQHYGQVIGSEEAGKGASVTLAPTINIVRDPRWGRAFESLGEDPYLSGQMAAADIQGIQSQGEIAQVKHWAVYNQETNRNTSADDAIVSDRAMQEIYFPAFQTAIDQGHVGSIMCSYSTINGTYACQNSYLNQVLRDQFQFPGFTTSDWYATHSTVQAANNGLDVQMPNDSYYGAALKAAVLNGHVSMATLDQHVRNILRTMFALGLFDHPHTGSPSATVTSPQHTQAALQTAEAGTVLLKNDGSVLPLDSARIHSIAVIGADAGPHAQTAGGGSASVNAPYVVTPYQGISRRAGRGMTVRYAEGVAPNGRLPGGPSLLDQAVQLAKSSDAAIVFASDFESEYTDLTAIDLPGQQNQLIAAVAAANPNTIVVLNTGSAVTMPWADAVKGILEAWYPGQEDGNAIAAVLFGDVNPSGKLPVTFPRSLSDVPASTPQQWPGVNRQVQYAEGVLVGYRWYDAKQITPLFPFGYGLSYTTFRFSHLLVAPQAASYRSTVTVNADVTNTGSRAGAEVVQLYLGDPATTREPPRQLKGFQKVTLQPGETKHVRFTLDPRAFSYWNEQSNGWVVADGTYQVMVGDSSRNLPLQGSFDVRQTDGPRYATVHAPNILTPGAPATVTTSFTNGGDIPVHQLQLSLQVPHGWMAQATSPDLSPIHLSREKPTFSTLGCGYSPWRDRSTRT